MCVTVITTTKEFNIDVDQTTKDYLIVVVQGITGAGGSSEFSVLDGIADTTEGFISGQAVFELPSGKKAQRVSLNINNAYLKETAVNSGFLGTWLQNGNEVTLTPALETGDYLYIEYK